MGVMPVNRLLLTMSLPMMISMLVQALYNVVDSVFVSYISEDALAAVGLAFPAQNLMISVAVGTGVGINALLSKSLGEKNFETGQPSCRQRRVPGLLLLGRLRRAGRLLLPHLHDAPDPGGLHHQLRHHLSLHRIGGLRGYDVPDLL